MSIRKKISIFTMVFVMSILFLAPVNADAATVGQQLTNPETGWQRIDDKNSKIIYDSTFSSSDNNTNNWLSTLIMTNANGGTARFKFKGTKIRILVPTKDNRSKNISIKIDESEEYFSEYSQSVIYQCLVYEKSNLTDAIHTVTITNTEDSSYLIIDAIDIDDSGYIVDYYQPTNLSATSENNRIDLSWDVVEGATSYNIKRSTTAGGPYNTIATGSAVTFTDSDVTPGTIYYYVVSSIVSDTESSNSNEASATLTDEPTQPGHTGNTATLILTMTNGDDKVYNLSIPELDNFLIWYDSKSDGTGKAYYVFTKTESIAPYISVKEYVSFDKISSFEVKEYNQ